MAKSCAPSNITFFPPAQQYTNDLVCTDKFEQAQLFRYGVVAAVVVASGPSEPNTYHITNSYSNYDLWTAFH